MSSRSFHNVAYGVGLLTAMLVATPASAADTTNLSIAAGLGLTAATGKTTIGDGGGAIEAAILTTDAMNQAGAIIAGLVRGVAEVNKRVMRRVLLLTPGEQVNLGSSRLILARLASLTANLGRCPDPGKASVSKDDGAAQGLADDDTPAAAKPRIKFKFSDITAALAQDTEIKPITIAPDNRLLVQAIAANRRAKSIDGSPTLTPIADEDVEPSQEAPLLLTIPSEIADYRTKGSKVLDAYDTMLASTDRLAICEDAATKGAVGAAYAYATALNTSSDKTGLSPLFVALQDEALTGSEPLILRVAVEQAGGSAITNANIFLTLGLPGAATINTGLIVSYRLIEPLEGQPVSTGTIVCATSPVNLKAVYRRIAPTATGTRRSVKSITQCAYVASTYAITSQPTPAGRR